MTAPPTEEKVEKVATAVLSTTAKAKARAKKLEKEKAGDSMETDEKEPSGAVASAATTEPAKAEETTDKKSEDGAKDAKTKKEEEEATFGELQNLSRVVPAQRAFVKLKSDSRYAPIKKVTFSGLKYLLNNYINRGQGALGGILLLADKQSGQAEELIEFSTPKG